MSGTYIVKERKKRDIDVGSTAQTLSIEPRRQNLVTSGYSNLRLLRAFTNVPSLHTLGRFSYQTPHERPLYSDSRPLHVSSTIDPHSREELNQVDFIAAQVILDSPPRTRDMQYAPSVRSTTPRSYPARSQHQASTPAHPASRHKGHTDAMP